jgi:hypothetical protein
MDTFIVWGYGVEPTGLVAADGVDHEDWLRVFDFDPELQHLGGPYADALGDRSWVMVVDADVCDLQRMLDEGEVRGFAPRFA